MYDENELISIKWTTRNKNYYEEKQYEYTGIGSQLFVNASDIPDNSSIHITATCDCDDCNNVQKTPKKNYINIINKYGIYRCKPCAFKISMEERDEKNKQKIYQIFLDLCEQHGDQPITTIEEYKHADDKFKFICHVHGLQDVILTNAIHNNAWCYWCGKESMAKKQQSSIEELKNLISSKHNNTWINPDEYINRNTKNIKIKCGICNTEFTTSMNSYTNSSGYCPLCARKAIADRKKITMGDFLKYVIDENGDCCVRNPYDFKSMNDEMEFFCSICNNPFVTTPHNYIKRGFTRCPTCSKNFSNGENIIKRFLSNNNINFIYQMRFDQCRDKKRLPFDFYLPLYNLLIEFDGEQHYKPIPIWGGEKGFKIRKYHDELKNQYCKKNNIELLRIPYYEIDNIDDILIKTLNNIKQKIQS